MPQEPAHGPIVVTGAAGGVGSVAIAVLSKLGYHVIASTGRMSEADYLKGLGATEVIDTALTSGKINVYPEYIGEIDQTVFHQTKLPPTAGSVISVKVPPLMLGEETSSTPPSKALDTAKASRK